MNSVVLGDDALRKTGDACEVRIGLPWIRSIPLWCVEDVRISIDGTAVDVATVLFEGRQQSASAMADASSWWFIQDRLVVRCQRSLSASEHVVKVTIALVIPYLDLGGVPLRRSFTFTRAVPVDATRPRISKDVK